MQINQPRSPRTYPRESALRQAHNNATAPRQTHSQPRTLQDGVDASREVEGVEVQPADLPTTKVTGCEWRVLVSAGTWRRRKPPTLSQQQRVG
jgi:hypothetical protein